MRKWSRAMRNGRRRTMRKWREEKRIKGLMMNEKVKDTWSRSEHWPMEQSGPIQLGSQVQRPVSALYTPWPWHCSGHCDLGTSHSGPVQPSLHRHWPDMQVPWPEHVGSRQSTKSREEEEIRVNHSHIQVKKKVRRTFQMLGKALEIIFHLGMCTCTFLKTFLPFLPCGTCFHLALTNWLLGSFHCQKRLRSYMSSAVSERVQANSLKVWSIRPI